MRFTAIYLVLGLNLSVVLGLNSNDIKSHVWWVTDIEHFLSSWTLNIPFISKASTRKSITCRPYATHLETEPRILIIMPMGRGKVISSPAGIHCGLDNKNCVYSYPQGTEVTLTPIAQCGWRFNQWSGGCNRRGQVYMDNNKFCMATFVKRDVILKP